MVDRLTMEGEAYLHIADWSWLKGLQLILVVALTSEHTRESECITIHTHVKFRGDFKCPRFSSMSSL